MKKKSAPHSAEKSLAPEFTSDWFSHNISNFIEIKKVLGEVDNILEIGSYEGRSTCWMLENILSDKGKITCIDPFSNDQINPFNGENPTEDRTCENRFRKNIALYKKPKQKVEVTVSLSFPALAKLIVEKRKFDFIYIDGNHCCDAVMSDAVMAWGLLRKGGILLFDDYLFEHDPDILGRGKISIDAFCTAFTRQFNWKIINYQLAIQKIVG